MPRIPHNEAPFYYDAAAYNGEWQLSPPFFMVDEIEAQRLRVRVPAAD